MDVYFSADVETDGPIPGRYSMLSFGIVRAGTYDGQRFERARSYHKTFYRELRPISDAFQPEALAVNKLDRDRLAREGAEPAQAMRDAARFIHESSVDGRPVLVAYPLSFDWTWLYWYFVAFHPDGSPFDHSRCFDIEEELVALFMNKDRAKEFTGSAHQVGDAVMELLEKMGSGNDLYRYLMV